MTALINKRVLITGATGEIGNAIARQLHEKGCQLCLTATRESALKELTSELGSNVQYLCSDLMNIESTKGLIAKVISQLGGIDILINNAGTILPIGLIHEIKPEEWSNVIDTNLKSVFYTINSVLPKMIKNGEGTILNVSSGAAHNPLPAWSHYCSSKAGAAMLTQCLHTEYNEFGIRALGLSPGTVATQMQLEIKESGINQVSKLDWSAHIPADWPAKALLWMCGPEANEFVGKEISLRDEAIRRKVKLI